MRWRAPTNGLVTFSTLGSGFDTVLAAYTGTALNNLEPVAADDDRAGFYASRIVFSAFAGQEYYIVISGIGASRGHVILDWCLEPSNEEIPRIVSTTASQTLPKGTRIPLVVDVRTRGQVPSHQWYQNGIPIPGAQANTLTIENFQAVDVGVYQLAAWIGTRTNWGKRIDLQLGARADFHVEDKLAKLRAKLGRTPSGVIFGPGAGVGTGPIRQTHRFSRQASSIVVPISLGAPVDHIFDNYGSGPDPGQVQEGSVLFFTSDYRQLKPSTSGYLSLDTTTAAPKWKVTVIELTNDIPVRRWALTNITDLVQMTVPVKTGNEYLVTWLSTRDGFAFSNTSVLHDGQLQFAREPIPIEILNNETNILRALAVAASSDSPVTDRGINENLTFEWRRDGEQIAGADQPRLLVSEIGNYTVSVIWGSRGTISSSPVAVSPVVAPMVNQQPVNQTIVAGNPITNRVVATGSSLYYQWFFNNQPIPKANGPTHVITASELNHAGQYHVVISNRQSLVVSSNAAVLVGNPPLFTLQPTSQTFFNSTNVTLTVAINGTTPIDVSWFKNGTILANETNATVLLSINGRAAGGSFSALATNLFGSAMSSNAVIRLLIPSELRGISLGTNGSIGFVVADHAGLGFGHQTNYVVQVSSNLVNWNQVSSENGGSIQLLGDQLRFKDTSTSNAPHRFYRVIER